MFVYADEWGNTGRNIFSAPDLYFGGAILATQQIDGFVTPVLSYYAAQLNRHEIHGSEIASQFGSAKVGQIAYELIAALDCGADWTFHVTGIHKPYIATTKFVDTVFDSGENLGVRPLWYIHPFFRHALCCLVDELLEGQIRQTFWDAFLAGEATAIVTCVTEMRRRLPARMDKRLRQIVSDAFDFASNHPEEFTLAKSRRGYRDHTPNMIAFANIMAAAHDFAKKHGLQPKAFFHDEQTEFGASMKQTYELFSKVRWNREKDWIATPELPGYDLGQFSMPSSKSFPPLQVADALLWVVGRENDSAVRKARNALNQHFEPHYIARGISESICSDWNERLAAQDFDHDAEENARRIRTESEARWRERLDHFEAEPHTKG